MATFQFIRSKERLKDDEISSQIISVFASSVGAMQNNF
jgi:hypothetical protein